LPIALWQANVERVHRSDEYRHPAYEYQRAPYQFYNVSYADNVSLIDQSRPELGYVNAGALVARLTKNFPYVAKAVGEAISAGDFYWRRALSSAEQHLLGRQVVRSRMVLLPIISFAALALIGLLVLARGGAWLMVLVILGSVGLICTTPWRFQFQRYLAPSAPFLTIAAVMAFSKLSAELRGLRLNRATITFGRVALAGLVVLTFTLQIYTAWRVFREREHDGAAFVPGRETTGQHFFYHDRLWCGWEKATAWIEEHSAPNAIVATPYSHLCYLLTGRHAVSPPVESNPARARRLLESVPVSYVIVDRGYSLAAIDRNSPGWRLVQTFDGTRLYERTASVKP
jgi:hypothetical protein